MKNRIILSFAILACLAVQAGSVPLLGQSYYSAEEPGKSYWQVHTDYKTRNTVVQFFNARHHVIYEEKLPRKYVSLTKQNIRRFDNLLTKLTDHSLLGSAVKSYDLVADSRTNFREIWNHSEPVSMPTNHQTPASNVYVVREGKLKIILKNPYRQHFDISILDDQLRTIHYEGFDEAGYDRSFDLSKLAEGKYKVRINSRAMNLYYKLSVDALQGYALEHLNSR
jgi:hypothetical protein